MRIFWDIAFWVICIFLILLLIAAHEDRLALKNKPEPELSRNTCGFASQVEYENFKRLHRFHGTLSSFDKDGSCVYMRDGQTCSLWDPLTRTDR